MKCFPNLPKLGYRAILFQKQSSKDTDLINDLRLNLSSKDSQILALEESITLLKKDKIILRRMLSKLYQQYEIIQGMFKNLKSSPHQPNLGKPPSTVLINNPLSLLTLTLIHYLSHGWPVFVLIGLF